MAETTNTKVCTACTTEKPLSDFTKARATKDGLNYECKPCACARVNAATEAKGDAWKVAKREYDRERVARLKPLLQAQQRVRYQINREQHAITSGKWAKNNPEKRRVIAQNYKHRRRAVEREGMTSSELLQWKNAQLKICYWCAAACSKTYCVDHYTPLAKGGKHEAANLVIACRSCNARKAARDPIAFAHEIGRLF